MTDTPQNKPREWMIRMPTLIANDLNLAQQQEFADRIHVIEHSAYLAERTRAKKAISMLKCIANQNYGTEFEAIEYCKQTLRELGE